MSVKPPPAVVPLPSMRGSENVLFVEDDEVVRKMVAGILTADGYRMTAVKSFAEALRAVAPAAPVQLLIADLAGEGEKFARQLFGARPALRVGTDRVDKC